MSSTIDPSGAIAAQATSGTTTPNGFSALTSEQFIKVIFTELSKQDPLQPSDSSKLLEQLSSIRSIQAEPVASGPESRFREVVEARVAALEHAAGTRLAERERPERSRRRRAE